MSSTTAPGGRDAHQVLRDGASLLHGVAVLGGEQQLRDRVRSAFTELREHMIRRDLAAIPVARLKDVSDGGVRIGALERAGYTTVAHVYAASAARLQAIPGVGTMTADQAVAAARQVADAIRNGMKFRVDLDPSGARSTELICALFRWDSFIRLADRWGNRPSEVADGLTSALHDARPTTSRVRMFLRGQRRRDAARAALDYVAQTLQWATDSGFASDLAYAHDLYAATSNVADVAWRDFEQRSIEYYGRLGEIVDLSLDVAAAEGMLPADIVERVNQQQLDDTLMRVSLRGYQSFGARFALVQRRVIIGDEMGLGKTIEAIAVMAHLHSLDRRRFLVACPASVLVNWTREVAVHSALHPYRLHGPERGANLAAWICDGGVAVATVDSLHHVRLPADIPLDLLVVDEAHYVKNPRTRRARNVRVWTDRAERVLFLTGTPMENRVDEFKNLVEYLRPDLVASIDARHAVAGPDAFRRAVAPAYLRRNQEDVAYELPELMRVDEWVELGAHERRAYSNAVRDGNFMAMRRAAYEAGALAHSAKLARLVELVEEANDNERKVVVFSFFRTVLEVVQSALDGRVFGPLTGGTPPSARQALVDEFSAADGHAVLISQIQAGGVGLNMQAASVAILCEPQLKPASEEQAAARLHRMGQVRNVQVHRILAADTCDERLLELLAAKSQLFADYARQSDVARATPDAVDVSDVELTRKIVELEQERLAAEAVATLGGPDTEPSAEVVI